MCGTEAWELGPCCDKLKAHKMRKVILSIMVSVDGFIDGPNKELDWHVFDGKMEKYMSTEVLNKVDAILAWLINSWPITGHPRPRALHSK